MLREREREGEGEREREGEGERERERTHYGMHMRRSCLARAMAAATALLRALHERTTVLAPV